MIEKKICCRCHIEKPISEFSKDKNTKDGFCYRCRECDHIRRSPNSPRKIKHFSKNGFAFCFCCKKEKPLIEFGKRKDRKGVSQSVCRECNNKKRYEKSHERGVCITCGEPTQKGNTRCYKCAIEDPHRTEKLRNAALEQQRDPIYVEKQLIGRIGQGFWMGNPILSKDYHKTYYCEKFEEVDPRVRAFQGTTCLICEKSEKENGRRLHDHHAFYEKKTCCWIDNNGEYWTNLNVRGHKQDYYIGDNPNYFALLCNECHGKTGGGYENRKFWADVLKNIIDTKFEGKSYYTEEEMIECGYVKISRTKWKNINTNY